MRLLRASVLHAAMSDGRWLLQWLLSVDPGAGWAHVRDDDDQGGLARGPVGVIP